jgi:malonyl-CoA/methylmalonyl-CoA synthetase
MAISSIPVLSRLPNEAIFKRLIENSKTIPNVVINDPTCGVEADYTKLLHDIVTLRQELYEALSRTLFDNALIRTESPYVLVQSTGNYEFIVACFAVLAFGGAIVPIGKIVLQCHPALALEYI